MAGAKVDEKTSKNKQINYSILKLLWQLRNDGKKMPAFYNEVGIDRNRYTSILVKDKSRTPKLKKKSSDLSDASGIHESFFMGESVFTVKGITDTQWDTYCFNLEKSADPGLAEGNRKKAKKECRAFEKKLKEVLRETPFMAGVDLNLLTAYYYYAEGKEMDGSEVQLRMQRLVNLMQSMGITQIESLALEDLDQYAILLKKQWEMVSAIKTYKKYKNL